MQILPHRVDLHAGNLECFDVLSEVVEEVRAFQLIGRRYPQAGSGRADYKTDYIPVGRSWTPLDDAMAKSTHLRAIWTSLDESGQRASWRLLG
jgi:hypothetical protein